jgi:uncharacterized protein YndB with AHSA1/START domain
MANYNREALFDALADGVRRRILDVLAVRECSAGEIAEGFDISRPAVSRHLRKLREAGLVQRRTEAQWYEYSFPIAAGVDALFAALTQEEELEQWFAEHMSVDARKGGRMDFWGRHTVGTPKQGEAGGLITDFEAGERLGFEWKLFGVPSTVRFTLFPEETEGRPSTPVTVGHDFQGLPDAPRPRELVDDWWRLCLGNLTAHTTSQGEVMRVDFADAGPEIRLSMHVEAPLDKVFRALTKPECLNHLNQWMAKDAEVDLRVEGGWDLGWDPPEGYTGPGMKIRRGRLAALRRPGSRH